MGMVTQEYPRTIALKGRQPSIITAGGGKAVASQYDSPPARVRFYHLDFQRPESAGQNFPASADLLNAAE
ncbi:MAG TPA: hypothetical protein VL912_02350 [Candidatus Udaeobacter sp.]|nr:hypothetical protein [Candidatus Udaeobacter sp.]